MSRARGVVLEALRSRPGSTPLRVLAEVTGLHVNTLRGHLEALEQQRLVERTTAPPSGRGRPPSTYRAVEPVLGSEYAGLASTLAAAIHHASRRPRAAAIEAGTTWGRDLASEHGRPARADETGARRAVVALLDRLGFAPRTDRSNTTVRLTRCPLLEAARRHPDVVCGVHLGIVRGALEEYGATGVGSELHPFSDPGACRLQLLGDRLGVAPS